MSYISRMGKPILNEKIVFGEFLAAMLFFGGIGAVKGKKCM